MFTFLFKRKRSIILTSRQTASFKKIIKQYTRTILEIQLVDERLIYKSKSFFALSFVKHR